MKDQVVTVRITSTTLDALKFVCEYQEISVPEAIRNAIIDYIKNDYIKSRGDAIVRSYESRWKRLIGKAIDND